MFGFRKKYKDFIPPSDELKDDSRGSLKDFIDGSVLTSDAVVQQLPFVLFLVVLAIFYISNRYRSERVFRDMVTLEKELKELRFESITTASYLMEMSKQSEVLKRVQREGLNLQESLVPPIKIYLKE